jgi:hypothetical protein
LREKREVAKKKDEEESEMYRLKTEGENTNMERQNKRYRNAKKG